MKMIPPHSRWLAMLLLPLILGGFGISQANGANILFVVSSLDASDPTAPSNENDLEVATRLRGQGHTVTVADDQDAALGDLFAGKELILISSSVGSANQPLNSLSISSLQTGRIPVVVCEPGLYDELLLQRENTFGNAGGHTSLAISVANQSHPLAAGESGAIDIVDPGNTAVVSSSALPYTVGTNAIIIATNATVGVDEGRICIWAYEKASRLADDITVVPARRVAFFYNASTPAATYNTNATDLFDAAIRWALQPPPNLPILVVFRSPPAQNAAPDAPIIAELEDGSSTHVNTNAISLFHNGSAVTPAVTKSGTITSVAFTPTTIFPAASTNTILLVYSDNASTPQTFTNTFQFTVQNYPTLPPTLKVPVSDIDTNKPGFTLRLRQMAVARPGGGNVDSVRGQLNDEYIDPATGMPYDDLIDRTQTGFQPPGSGFNPDKTFTETGFINYNQDANGVGAEAGVFTADNGFADKPIPGIPGTTLDSDNIALQARTYLELKAGLHRFAVNSDDGFRVTAESVPQDILRTTSIAGEFNADRGQGTTLVYVLAQEDGFYPFELIWWDTTGGAEVEFFSVDSSTGANVLVNDRADLRAIKAYRSATSRPFVASVRPAPNATGVPVTTNITLTIMDADTQVVTNTIQLALDGTRVDATVTKSAGQTTVSYDPPGDITPATRHTIQLTYTDTGTPPFTRTGSAAFLTDKPAGTLPPIQQDANGLAVWEAENFDTNTPSADHQWIFEMTPPGFSGLGTMYSLPELGATIDLPGALTDSPGLSYQISFVKTGTHYFWFRGSDGGGNSLTAGIDADDPTGTTLDNMDDFAACCGTRAPGGTSWVWVGGIDATPAGRATFTVASAGVHTIHLWMREDGQIVDKLLVTTDANFIPAGLGPPESARVGQATPPRFNPPIISGSQVTITWTGSGLLQEAGSLTGNSSDWSNVNPQPSGNTFAATVGSASQKFYRIRQ